LAIAAAAQQPQHARVNLLARQEAAGPGTTLQIGVHFILEPGWHIYWTNPGDSGQPPVFKWQLPSGFSAGEIQWPRPERMQPIPQLADFGYHGEVLLPVQIAVPASAKAGSTAQIAADAKWLICREVCIPEHAQLQLALPIAASAREGASAPLFAVTEKLLPQPLPRGWKASAISAKDNFVLSLQAGRKIEKAEFFPLDPGQIDNPAPQGLQPLPAGLKITLKKSDLLVKPISVLRGVLVLPGGLAYKIEAPVRQPLQ
jgi:thiol:disulfide interchange protein DsbD